MSRKMATSDSSGRSSVSSSGYHTNVPRKSSEWKNKHLQELGIHYQEKKTSIQDFMSRLQREFNMRKFKPAFPENISERLIECTNEIWSFSLNINDTEFGIHCVDWTIDKIQESTKRLAMNEDILEESEKENRMIFWTWRVSLHSFLTHLKKFVRRLLKDMRKACYTELFKMFTKVCLLDPEPGEVYMGTQIVKGLKVHSIPDVRYVSCSDQLKTMLVFLTEVEKDDAFRGDFSEDTFCFENLSSRVLGQHGIELLIEAQDSCFWPHVAGIICVGTKVVFTYLDITKQHLIAIGKKTSTSNHTASIMYTRPYDFLDGNDRKVVLKLLFWFGYVQTGGYEPFLA